MPNKVDPEARELEMAILQLERDAKSLEIAQRNFNKSQKKVDFIFDRLAKKNGPKSERRWTSKTLVPGD